jgi:hypothetical protein
MLTNGPSKILLQVPPLIQALSIYPTVTAVVYITENLENATRVIRICNLLSDE